MNKLNTIDAFHLIIIVHFGSREKSSLHRMAWYEFMNVLNTMSLKIRRKKCMISIQRENSLVSIHVWEITEENKQINK